MGHQHLIASLAIFTVVRDFYFDRGAANNGAFADRAGIVL